MTGIWMPVLAEAAPAAPAGGPGGMLVPMLLFFGIVYFMMIRPQQRKEKERRAMIEKIKTGDRILFSGILGTVSNVKDDVLVVKVAENVKMEIVRGAVVRVMDKGEKPGKDDAAA